MRLNAKMRRFYDDIYALVASIPAGRVMTYGQIALWLGHPRGARWVGRAMSCAPGEGLPCHRVVRADGSLAPPEVFGGRQRALLEAEGVLFRKNGRVDLAACLLPADPADSG